MKCLYCKVKEARNKYCSRRCSQNFWTKNNRSREDVTWYSLRHRGIRDKIKYFSREDYKEWLAKQPQICHYCGLPKEYLFLIKQIGEQWNMGLPAQWVTSREFQVDRMDSNKGYSADNMVLACPICNTLKSYYWNYDEFKKIAELFLKAKWKKIVRVQPTLYD